VKIRRCIEEKVREARLRWHGHLYGEGQLVRDIELKKGEQRTTDRGTDGGHDKTNGGHATIPIVHSPSGICLKYWLIIIWVWPILFCSTEAPAIN
jgi:hypothetical protein